MNQPMLTENQLIQALKAMASDVRMRVLALCSHGKMIPNGTLASIMKISEQNMSRHMLLLETAQLVQKHKTGSYVYYSLNRDVLSFIGDFIKFEGQNERLTESTGSVS